MGADARARGGKPVSHWYRITDQPPPLTVRVRVSWSARIFVAVRGRHPSGREVWAAVDVDGRSTPVLLEGAPELWQPLHPDAWRLPLPDPVVPSEPGRFFSERTRFQAVEDAEASDLAREMEHNRGARSDESSGPVDPRWWWVGSEIRYQRAGEVSLKMAEGRLMRAVACCGAGQGLTLIRIDVAKVLADLATALEDDEARAQEADLVRFRPMPNDHADFLEAMRWFTALNPPEARSWRWEPWSLTKAQQVLLLRTLPTPLSYAEIGHELGWKGHQRAREVYQSAIDKAWRVANGLVKTRDYVAELQRVNRMKRRQAA